MVREGNLISEEIFKGEGAIEAQVLPGRGSRRKQSRRHIAGSTRAQADFQNKGEKKKKNRIGRRDLWRNMRKLIFKRGTILAN